MEKLHELKLIDLVLERYQANSLMDAISLRLNHTLNELTLVNLTACHCTVQQIGTLDNLKVSVKRSVLLTIKFTFFYLFNRY